MAVTFSMKLCCVNKWESYGYRYQDIIITSLFERLQTLTVKAKADVYEV